MDNEFRRYLVSLPQKCGYKFTRSVREEFHAAILAALKMTPELYNPDLDNHYHIGRPCAHKFNRGETCYRCLTCGYDDTCVLCCYCFRPELHVGHQVHRSIIQRDNPGCCDCGDPEAFPHNTGTCNYYSGVGMDDPLAGADEQEFTRNFEEVVATLMDFVIDLVARLPPSGPGDGSNTQSGCLRTPEEVVKYSNDGALDPNHYGEPDPNSSEYALLVYNDQVHQFRDAVQRVRRATGKTAEFASMIVRHCESKGNAIVMISEDVDMLLKRQAVLGATGITTAVKSMRDVFRIEMIDEIATVLAGVTTSMIVDRSESVRNAFGKVLLQPHIAGSVQAPDCPSFVPFRGEFTPIVKVWEIPQDVAEECHYTDPGLTFDPDGTAAPTEYPLTSASRFQLLVYHDIRLNRQTRLNLHDVYSTMLIQDLRYKLLSTSQILDYFESFCVRCMAADREPDCSLQPQMTVQLFTCPSSCRAILRHGDHYRIIREIGTLLQRAQAEDRMVPALRNRLWAFGLRDIGYIATRCPDPDAIIGMLNAFPAIASFMSVLQGRPAIKREASRHVEYESADYAVYFNAVAAMMRLSTNLARCLNEGKGDPDDGARTKLYSPLLRKIVENSFEKEPGDNQECPVVIYDHKVVYNILADKVSFLHPLHATLSYFLEADRNIRTPEDAYRIISLADMYLQNKVPGAAPGDGIKGLLEMPLRTLVLVSQVKVGLWVRNGMSVRAQRNIYKHAGLRDYGFMRDLYMVQATTAFIPPEEAMEQFVDRWGMTAWSHGQYNPETAPWAPEMAQEFILFLINVLTEDMHLHSCGVFTDVSDKIIEREIIHSLCFRPVTYTELTSELPECLLLERRFFIGFHKIAEEIPTPHGSDRERKTYRLKEQYYSQIDPFYPYYTANKRDDCVRLLKNKLHTEVIEPKQVDWSDSPYSGVTKISGTTHLLEFAEQTVRYCIEQVESDNAATLPDQLFPLILHLIHTTVKQKERLPVEKSTIPSMLYRMLGDERYSSVTPKVRAILHIICHEWDLSPDEVRQMIPDYSDELASRPKEGMKDAQQAIRERKRLLARKKRERVLARMKKQQQAFAARHQGEEELMDVDGDDNNNEDEDAENDETNAWSFPEERCILCQMPATSSNEPFGMFSYVSPSNEFRSVPTDSDYWFYKAFSCQDLNKADKVAEGPLGNHLKQIESEHKIGPGFPDSKKCCSENHAVVTSCGHGMHFSCYVGYVRGVRARQASQLTRTAPADTGRGEFLCPLCRAVGNVFVPICYSINNERFYEQFGKQLPVDQLMKYTAPEFTEELQRQFASGPQRNAQQELIKRELVAAVKKNIKPGRWFLNDSGSVITTSKTFAAMNDAASSLAVIALPFDGISSTMTSTIQSLEISLRGLEGPDLIEQLPAQSVTTLRVWCQLRDMVRCAETATSTTMPAHSGSFLTYPQRLIGLITNLCGDEELLCDGESYFKLLVGAEPLQFLGMTFQELAGICYVRHVQQSLLKVAAAICTRRDSPELSLLADRDAGSAADVLKQFVTTVCGPVPDASNLAFSMVERLVTPFLRQTLIYAYVRFGNYQKEKSTNISMGEAGECDTLCTKLGLPSLRSVINRVRLDIPPPDLRDRVVASGLVYPGPIRLIRLPDSLSAFFTKSVAESRIQSPPTDPAVCLYCGEVLNLQKANIGDRYGPCNMHVEWGCLDSNGWGLFLVPRNNCVLLLGRKRGTFIEGPYVDVHGESDSDQKRSYDFRLSQKAYDELVRGVWLQHNIQNKIARQMESQVDIGGWQTL